MNEITRDEMATFFENLEQKIAERDRKVIAAMHEIGSQLSSEYQRMAEETRAARAEAQDAKRDAAEARKSSSTALKAVRDLEEKIERLTTIPAPALTERAQPPTEPAGSYVPEPFPLP